MQEGKKWETSEIAALYAQPFNDLLFQAHSLHREYNGANKVQLAKLLSIKTGACPEDCGYCAQSGHYDTKVEKEVLMDVDKVLSLAAEAKANGATRFCMGAAYRSPPQKAMEKLTAMVAGVKALGLETCMTLGMLDESQAQAFKAAGLDFYNHNIDTSPSYYEKVVTTRRFADRLDTLQRVREAGIAVCCGGILGLGETRQDRIEFLQTLANLDTPPESVPINMHMRVAGTALSHVDPVDDLELVRTIATARLLMPTSAIRLTAGRISLSASTQALCYFAGANSVFIGDKLLTEDNPEYAEDKTLFAKLGIEAISL